MKRKLTFLTAVFALLAFLAMPMGMKGQSDYSTDYTGNITLSHTGGTSAGACKVIIDNTQYDGIKAGTGSVAGAMKINVPANTKYLHFHIAGWKNQNVTLAITPTGYSENIALTNNSGITGNSPFTFNGDPSTSDYYKVITFDSALTENTELTFTATTGNRFVIWGATSEEEGGTTITVATPTISPASGTYTEAQTVTITCETSDADIFYTLDGSIPTDESEPYSTPFTVSETTTVKAIAYADDNHSSVATATYTIVTPMTIAEVRALSTGSNVLTTGTVTSCVGSTAYIQDATAAICVYGNSLTVGDNITVSGVLTNYNGLLEITNPVVTVNTSGNTVNPEVMTVAEVLASTNQGWYVRIEEATVTAISGQNTTISQDGSTIVVRGITGVEYAVNDIISLDGNIGIYNSTNQIANPQNVEVQVSSEPAITVTPSRVDVPCDAATGTLSMTLTAIDENTVEIRWFDAEGADQVTAPTWVTTTLNSNNIGYEISANTGDARAAYMKVYGEGNDGSDVYSDLITFSQGHYIPDYATLPFEFDEGKSAIAQTAGLTQTGLGNDYSNSPKLRFDDTDDCLILHFLEEPGKLSFDIKGNTFSDGTFTVQVSEDGTTYTDLASYTELAATQSEEFNNLGSEVRYIKWVYTNKATGNVALGNIKLLPANVASYNLTVEAFENLELITFVDTEDELALEGAGTIQVTEGSQVMLSIVANEGYAIQSLMVDGEEHVNDIANDATYTFDMPGHDITISATAVEVIPPTPGNWVLTSLADLTENDIFVIVGTDADTEATYALPYNGGGQSGAPAAIAVTVVDGTLSGEIAEELQWNVSGNATDGYTFYPNGDAESWLYCNTTQASSSNNNIRVGTGNRNLFVLDENGYLITNDEYVVRYLSIYFNSGVAQDWRGYINTTNGALPISFYKKVSDETSGQTTDLTEGWNWFSIYIEATDPVDVILMLEESLGENGVQIKNADFNTSYEEGEWFGDLDDEGIVSEQMYKVLVSNDCTVTLEGEIADPADHPITIEEGWNWIGFPVSEVTAIEDAMADFDAEEGDLLKNSEDFTTFEEGEWFGDIEEMEPGQGYMYFSNGSEEKDLIYQTAAKHLKK